MAIRDIQMWPSPALRGVAKDVNKIGDDDIELIHDMIETMRDSNGLGISAPQVGVLKRIIVIDDKKTREGILPERDPTVMINPEIIDGFGEMAVEEGCLSLPGQFVIIQRASHITVRYMTIDGENKESDVDGVTAVILQHEIDHLDGKLIIDRLFPEDRAKAEWDMFSVQNVEKLSKPQHI